MALKPLSGRIILVTGASRGIGYASAVAMAKDGAHIIALARTQGGLEDLDDVIKSHGGETTLVPMDLKNVEAIDKLGEIINTRWGRLDGLFANAGVLGDITPAPHLKPDVFDTVMAINMTANYRLIRSLDPLLRASDAGRAVFVTSSVARTHRAYWNVYAASKAALETFALSYAEEISVTNLAVNLLDPGGMRTAMRAKAMPGEDASTLPDPKDIAPLVAEMLSPDYDKNGTLVKFQQTSYYKA